MEEIYKEGLRIEVDNDLFLGGGMPIENLQIEAVVDPDDDEELNSETEIDFPDVKHLPEPPANIRITFNSHDLKMKEDGEISGDESSSNKDQDETGVSDTEKFVKTSEESMELELDSLFDDPFRSSQRSSGTGRTDYMNRENIRQTRAYENPFLGAPEIDQKKLNLRALRFGTRASTPTVDEFPSFPDIPDADSEAALLSLYLKVGLLVDDGAPPSLDKVGSQHRTDAILIRGTNDMSTKDIFAYLAKYRHRPIKLEWVNDACCVVVFKDKFEAGKCLLMMTKPIIVAEKKMNPSLPTLEELDENSDKTDEPMAQDFDYDKVEAVPEKMITVPMPPGSIWRFAIPCEKAKGIIMRIAVMSDKKQDRAEKFSEYYKKHGNPNKGSYGARRTPKRPRVEDDDEDGDDEIGWNASNLPKPPISNKTAWSELSADWQAEELGIKRNKPSLKGRRRTSAQLPSGTKNYKVMVNFPGSLEPREGDLSAPVQARLKRKRDESSDEEDISNSKVNEDEGKNSSENEEDNFWTQRLKGPRMRMHADEEEEKIVRDKLFNSRYEFKSSRTSRPMSQRLGTRNSGWTSQTSSNVSLQTSSRSNVKDLREVIREKNKRSCHTEVDDGMDSDPQFQFV